MISLVWNLSKNTGRYVENTNKKNSFLLWQICQFNHYGWLILLKFYWFLISNSQNWLLACFLIRPILDPKFPLMVKNLIWVLDRLQKTLLRVWISGWDFIQFALPHQEESTFSQGLDPCGCTPKKECPT